MSDRRAFLKSSLGTGAFLTLASAQAWLAAMPAARAQAPAAKVTLQLNWFKSVQQGGHFVAIEKGFFRDEGIDCEVIQGGPGVDSIGLVASGRAMIGDRDSSNVLLARVKGIPIKGFAATYQTSPFCMMSLASKPVRGVGDMVGKTIAIPTQRRAPLTAILKRQGIDPSKVNFVPTGGDAGVLASGQVDAYFGWITNEGLSLKLRGVELFAVPVDDLGDPTYPQVMFATDQTLATRADLLLRWLRAEVKGWGWMADNPEETARMVVAKYGNSGLDLKQQIEEAKAYTPYIKGAAGSRVMWIDAAMFEAGKKLAREAGAMPADLPTADFYTQAIVRQAYANA
ncbi:ABC transporter substrate-binding protein [Pigmentiphaga soli]|uniref:Thiamine pyrimidine synthase n=1 Tax=Pigmentiphaga soli TaxID=1007095 RepID=A0ABP8HDC8_9BURK